MSEHDYTPAQLARTYGLDQAEVERAIVAGELRAKRWGGQTRVNVWQAAVWLMERREAAWSRHTPAPSSAAGANRR